MKTYRIETVECTKSVPIEVCDSCGKQFENPVSNWCPSQKVIMPMFIGFSEPQMTSRYSVVSRRYGVDLGEWCIDCREKWFNDILKMFPNAKKVSIND